MFIQASSSNGPLVVFLHGFMGSHHDFLPIAQNLSSSYNVVLLDLPGHGYSKRASFETFDDFLNHMHKALEPFKSSKIHWVGYSLGGRLIPYLASFYNTQSAVWISSKLLALSEEEKRRRKDFEEKILTWLQKKSFDDFLLRWYEQPLFKTLKNHPTLFTSLYELRRLECPKLMQKVFELTSPLFLETHPTPCSDLNFPKLYCAGALDEKYVREAMHLQKDPREFEIKLFEKTSHSLHLEKPNSFSRLLSQFLEESL